MATQAHEEQLERERQARPIIIVLRLDDIDGVQWDLIPTTVDF